MTTPAERSDELRVELLHRIWTHPVRTWSDTLLETIAHAIDLQFGPPPPPTPRADRHLTAVPDLEEPTPSPRTPDKSGACPHPRVTRNGAGETVPRQLP